MRSLVVLAALCVAACGGGSAGPATQRPAAPPIATFLAAVTPPTDTLDQAVIAFDGGYSRAEIKSKLDQALRLYDLEPTAKNYSRAGSSLVALRQSASDAGCKHCTEMEILSAMLSAGKLGNMTFPDGAAWAVTAIQALE